MYKLLKILLYCNFTAFFAILSPVLGQDKTVLCGAENTSSYVHLLANKNVAIVANQTSRIGSKHLIDSLLKLRIKIKVVFAPEHGFRGEAANGEHVKNSKDKLTGLPIFSLYGNSIKPTAAQLKNIDAVVFDIQDVGVRFYTYLTTLHYVMQACAENNKLLIVLDRPNPNSHLVDGPVLQKGFESMVGMHPIPIAHGMTLGELAKMINGEKWIGADTCKLIVVPCKNWTREQKYILPIWPSPNLPTQESIILYPTLGLLEGTTMSMGRGTEKPFECFGAPWLKEGNYIFTPKSIPGKAMNPPYENQTCNGFLLSDFAKNYLSNSKYLYIEWLELLFENCPDSSKLFLPFFDKLVGTSQFRKDLLAKKSLTEIRNSWKKDIDLFIERRKPYLIYP